MKKKLNLLLALLMAFALISCGGGDDDDNDDTPQREEDTTGSNGTTGTSGTSGTTGTTGSGGTTGSSGTTGTSGTSGTTGGRGPSASCMSNRQRENIRTFLNRASDLRTFNGSGTEKIREEDLEEVNDITGSFDFQQSSENTWIVNAGYCNTDGTNCQESQTVIAFKNGCLNVNGVRARIISASDSSLSYRYLENGTVRERASLASGELVIDQSVTRDGVRVYEFDFDEETP